MSGICPAAHTLVRRLRHQEGIICGRCLRSSRSLSPFTWSGSRSVASLLARVTGRPEAMYPGIPG